MTEDQASNASAPGALPRTLGPFRVEREVSRTAASVSVLASLGEGTPAVLLKVVEQGRAAGLTPEGLHLLANEARVARVLDHANVVRVRDAAVEGRHLYVVMDPLTGASVETLVSRNGKLQAQTAAQIALEVGKAIAFGHGRGLHHKNLKSTNVFVCPGGAVRVADFGLARVPDPMEKAGRGLDYSTMPQFLSPEQAAGDYDRIDQQTDVYALGVLLYRMLTGAYPFDESRGGFTLYQVLNSPPVPPHKRERSVPKALEAICLKALRKKPHERYWSMPEMATDLKRFLSGEPVRALEEASAASSFGRFVASPAGLGVAFALALALAVAGAVLLLSALGRGGGGGGNAPPEPDPLAAPRPPEAKRGSKVPAAREALRKAMDLPLSREKLAARLRLLMKATSADPDFKEAELQLGHHLLLAGKVQQATPSLARGSEEGGDPFSRYLWGLLYHEYLVDEEAAAREFQRGAGPGGKPYEILCRAWKSWTADRKKTEALQAIREAEEAQAYPWETGLLRGIILESPPEPNLQAARLAYTRASESLGGYVPAIARRAVVNLALGEPDLAARDLERALAIDPTHARARYARGLVRAHAGKAKEAVEDFTQAIETAPRFADALLAKGTALLEIEHFEEALEALTRAAD
ncbi:MAG: protein kinase, partial [Planctomycetes bacterium]|nr:protein kinase [Planctomycetota bacterium]